jgi:hypothetical protein
MGSDFSTALRPDSGFNEEKRASATGNPEVIHLEE